MQTKQQSGFIMMVLIVIMVIGAAAYFTNYSSGIISNMSSDQELDEIKKLKVIKQRLLNFASLYPEIYFKNSTSPYPPIDYRRVGAPGYFPCPFDRSAATPSMASDCQNFSVDPDSNSVTTNIIQGFLPPVNSLTRRFYFEGSLAGQGDYLQNPTQEQALSGKSLILVIDERFAFHNAKYNSSGIQTMRFAPLNSQFDMSNFPYAPDAAELAAIPPVHAPVLQLNDDGKSYVALIINPGYALNVNGFDQANFRPAPPSPTASPSTYLQGYLDRRYDDGSFTNQINGNADGDFKFYSAGLKNFGVNDVIVGITYEEWQKAMAARLCHSEIFFSTADSTLPYWFNDYDVASIPSGSGWRNIVVNNLGGFCD